jgi:hypothetical protein
LKGVPLVWAAEGQQHEYDYIRMMNGIVEGNLEMPYEKQIPLEANIQNMHGVHFEKVCRVRLVSFSLLGLLHRSGVSRAHAFYWTVAETNIASQAKAAVCGTIARSHQMLDENADSRRV